jgi:hypothetical protein
MVDLRFPLTDGGHMKLFSIIGTIVFVAVVALSLFAVMDILLFTSDKKKIGKKGAGLRRLNGHQTSSGK